MIRTIIALTVLVTLLVGGFWVIWQIEAAADAEALAAEAQAARRHTRDDAGAAAPRAYPQHTLSNTDLRVSGVVLENGGPAAKQRICAWLEDAIEPCAITRSDNEGRFTLTVPGPNAYRLTVGTTRKALVLFPMQALDARTRSIELTLPSAAMTGAVRDAEGNSVQGLAVLLVRADLPSGHRGPDGIRSTSTDAAGRYSFQRVWPGDYRLRVGGVSEQPPEVRLATRVIDGLTIEAKRELELDVELRRAASVAIHVVDESGGPMPDVRLHVRDARGWDTRIWDALTITDDDGRFEFLGIPSGPVNVVAAWANRSVEREIRLKPGQRAEVELRL